MLSMSFYFFKYLLVKGDETVKWVFVILDTNKVLVPSRFGFAIGSNLPHNNYFYDPKVIVLSLSDTLYPFFVILNSFTLDIGKVAYIGRCHNKKS